MNTNHDVIQSVRNLLAEHGIVHDESNWSKRLVFFYVMKARNIVLKRRMEDKRSRVSHFNKQTLSCVPLVETDINECPCTPPTGCFFKKSAYPIPNPIGRYMEVTSILANEQIPYVEWGRFKDKLNSRYKAEQTNKYFTLKNTGNGVYLYVYNLTHEFAAVTSIFENPIDVFLFPDCDGKVDKCAQYLDLPFIMDDAFIPEVLEATLKLLSVQNKADDIILNQQDDTSAKPMLVK